MTQMLRHVPNRVRIELDFVNSSDITAFTSAAGTISQQSAAGGVMRLATGANDNDACEARLDAAPFKFFDGARASFAAIVACPSDVDNADIGIGWATDDSDVIGDGATATELLYLGFDDQGSSDGSTPLVIKYKNGSGSGSITTPFSFKESQGNYMVQMTFDATSSGKGIVNVAVTPINAVAGLQVTVQASECYKCAIPYSPTGLLNFIVAIQAGEAAAKTWDIDYLLIDQPRTY